MTVPLKKGSLGKLRCEWTDGEYETVPDFIKDQRCLTFSIFSNNLKLYAREGKSFDDICRENPQWCVCMLEDGDIGEYLCSKYNTRPEDLESDAPRLVSRPDTKEVCSCCHSLEQMAAYLGYDGKDTEAQNDLAAICRKLNDELNGHIDEYIEPTLELSPGAANDLENGPYDDEEDMMNQECLTPDDIFDYEERAWDSEFKRGMDDCFKGKAQVTNSDLRERENDVYCAGMDMADALVDWQMRHCNVEYYDEDD